MRSDFPTQLFELSTLERTEGFVKAYFDNAFTSLYARPRINRFRGFKQELPTLTVAMKPFTLGNTEAVLENYFRFAYLDYSYADNLENLVPNFRSGRLETKHNLYRPFQWGPINFLPEAGLRGIFYSDSPNQKGALQAVLHYNFDTYTSLEKSYTNLLHTIEPYAHFSGYSTPTTPSDDVFIFSLQDGLNHLSQLKLGLRNQLTSLADFSPLPALSSDLYAYNFFNSSVIPDLFPKIGIDTTANFSKMSLGSFLGWNMEQNLLDFANFKLGYTFNDYFAFTAEVRHRGDYFWRKNNYNNYLLDVTRAATDLVDSPLSDYRTTFRCKWQLQLSPLMTLRILNHVGWRPNKPFYHESKVELQTIISNAVRLRFTYMRTVRTNQYTFGVNLV